MDVKDLIALIALLFTGLMLLYNYYGWAPGFKRDIDKKIAEDKAEWKAEIAALKLECSGNLGSLQNRMTTDVGGLRAEIGSLKVEMVRADGDLAQRMKGVEVSISDLTDLLRKGAYQDMHHPNTPEFDALLLKWSCEPTVLTKEEAIRLRELMYAQYQSARQTAIAMHLWALDEYIKHEFGTRVANETAAECQEEHGHASMA